MTPDEFKSKLASLGLTQTGASRILRVDDRSVRRWVSGERPVPGFAIAFLELLTDCPAALRHVVKKL
jgi:DNA-binding transcriptional regulator YiaG